MIYKCKYKTQKEFSDILMTSDGEYLTGLWFENFMDESEYKNNGIEEDLPVFEETKKWLDEYFSGKNPKFIPKYKLNNLTPFRKEVIDIINTITFGNTLTYKDIAEIIAKKEE